MNEKEVSKVILDKSKAKKFINNKKIIKVIFVKNRIINYIVPKMTKINLFLLIFFVFTLSCGFKVVDHSSLNNYEIASISTAGEKRMNID